MSTKNNIDLPTFFRPLTTNPFKTSIMSEHSIIKILQLSVPFVNMLTLQELQCTCKYMDNFIVSYLWKKPLFHNHSINDSLTMFRKFLDQLPHLRQSTCQVIRELDFTCIEESLYERVPKDFFHKLVKYTPKLMTLNLSHTNFMNIHSLPKKELNWQLKFLTSLDASYMEHMTDQLLLDLAIHLPQLHLIRLDSTKVNMGVGQLTHHCDLLSSLSLKQTQINDEALIALAKFRTIHISELDISHCSNITSTGLNMLAKYCIHLSWLGLAYTNISMATLQRFDNRFWKYLDISQCQQLHKDLINNNQNPSILDNFSTEIKKASKTIYDSITAAPNLEYLLVSTPTIDYLLNMYKQYQMNSLIPESYTSPSIVNRLVIYGLREHTPLNFIEDLKLLFPVVKHIKIMRNYFESDFFYGSYSTTDKPPITTTITENNLKKYYIRNIKNEPIVIEVQNQNEIVESTNMTYW
ncbi:hypothetical protein BJ944DRAFT_261515 [Cunninghamella echinulata]|nr:hypothetical protein BJ944DRAFT_261515 [Cunninghamella echinulata]